MRSLEFLIGNYLCTFATDDPILVTTILVLMCIAVFAKYVFAAPATPPVAIECFPRYEICEFADVDKNFPYVTDKILLARPANGVILHRRPP